ncbi:hypothetical protein ACFFON_14420 [Arthrobacter citreus]|uniref:hypothetical protein n=1 Tax=Arthrobacter TaxID=1663 RepID=UPI00126562A7|nr:hypothetical protein [Arthrobacter gandavensis]
MKRSPLLTSAAVLSAAGFGAAAAAVVRRMLRHGAVDHALRVSSKDADTGQLPVLSSDGGGTPPSALPGWHGNLPVTPVPPDAVTATAPETETEGNSAVDEEEPLPVRTWVVDNSADWDGNPLEMVVPPDKRLRKGQPGAAPA